MKIQTVVLKILGGGTYFCWGVYIDTVRKRQFFLVGSNQLTEILNTCIATGFLLQPGEPQFFLEATKDDDTSSNLQLKKQTKNYF